MTPDNQTLHAYFQDYNLVEVEGFPSPYMLGTTYNYETQLIILQVIYLSKLTKPFDIHILNGIISKNKPAKFIYCQDLEYGWLACFSWLTGRCCSNDIVGNSH